MYLVPRKTYFVYILSNRSKNLYIGLTNNLKRRMFEYKQGRGGEFAAKYKLDRLVYFERFESVHNAIDREKQLKRWKRLKKIALIVALNPSWKDLSEEWFRPEQVPCSCIGPSTSHPRSRANEDASLRMTEFDCR
jgi:putative endonuclease